MAFTDIDTLTSMVINELSQVPGVTVQKYSSPIIRQYLQTAYLLEIDDQWWPDYMMRMTTPVDTVSGLPFSDIVGPISAIDDYGDILYVWSPDSNKPLMALPSSVNPDTLIGGGTGSNMPVYITPDYTVPHRPFRIVPPNGLEVVTIYARQRTPIPFTGSTRVGIDPLLLMFDAAWQYCITDGTLPSQVAKYELLIRKRRQQLVTNFNNQAIPLDKRLGVDATEDFFIPITI